MSTLKVPYLLHEDPMDLLHEDPRIKCEKIQLNDLFESIFDEDVPYSIVVENIIIEETRDMLKAFTMLLCAF